MTSTAAAGIRVEMDSPDAWRSAGDWEPWPRVWNRMGLSSDELALLTALISVSFSQDAEDKQEIRKAAGLAHTRFNDAIKALEGRGLLTRTRTAVRGNGRTWRFYREPVPEDERTGEMPQPKKPRSRNAEQLTRNGSADGRPSVEEPGKGTQQNPTSTDVRMDVHPPCTDGRPSALPIQTSSDTSSSSLGSSSTAERKAGRVEEEEGSSSKNEEHQQVAHRMAKDMRFGPGRYLTLEAREQVEQLLVERLEDEWPEERLAQLVAKWCREAKNPTVHLPNQLSNLGPPRHLRVVTEHPTVQTKTTADPANDQKRTEATAVQTAEDFLDRGLKPHLMPSRLSGRPTPGAKRKKFGSGDTKANKGA